MAVVLTPVTIREATAFVASFHRHSRPPRGAKFAVGVSEGAGLTGVAIVGRPVARHLDDGYTAEVLRVCTRPEAGKGACSFLYARAWRAWVAMGGSRMLTYTLQSESGASLRGAGWKIIGEVKPEAGGWSRRVRAREWHPTYGQLKFRWEVNQT